MSEQQTEVPQDAANPFERVLDLEALMSSARRVERVVRLCLRPDLEAEYAALGDELGNFVDASGKLLKREDGDEKSLSDRNRAVEIDERMGELRRQMLAESYTVRFRGMSETEFTAFEDVHLGEGEKRTTEYWNKLLVQTAIAPKMTIDQVRALRDQLTFSQVNALITAAFEACTEGGLDVPKSPSYLRSPRLQES